MNVDINIVLNSISVIVSLIGGLLMWRNSPNNNSKIDGGGASSSNTVQQIKDERKNYFVRAGFICICIGGILQLINPFV